MGRLSSNVISGPGTWGMTTDNMVLMSHIPFDHPLILDNINLKLPAGQNIVLSLPAGHNIEIEVVT